MVYTAPLNERATDASALPEKTFIFFANARFLWTPYAAERG